MITEGFFQMLGQAPPWLPLALGLWALFALKAGGPWSIGAAVAALVAGANWGWPVDVMSFTALAAFVAMYFLRCAQDPYTPCWWCRGKSRRFNSEGNFHFCWVCGGSGKRDRFGAVVMGRSKSS